jgi:hypothetical protein
MSRAARRAQLQGRMELAVSRLRELATITDPVGSVIVTRALRHITCSMDERDRKRSAVSQFWKKTHSERDWKIDAGIPPKFGECLGCRHYLTADDEDPEFCRDCQSKGKIVEMTEEDFHEEEPDYDPNDDTNRGDCDHYL